MQPDEDLFNRFTTTVQTMALLKSINENDGKAPYIVSDAFSVRKEAIEDFVLDPMTPNLTSECIERLAFEFVKYQYGDDYDDKPNWLKYE